MPPRLCFDTSALNKLTADPELPSLLGGLTTGFRVSLLATNIDEIVGTSSVEQRTRLLSICRTLVFAGNCLQPYHEIFTRLAVQFQQQGSVDWEVIDIRLPEYENEIPRQEFIGDELAHMQRKYAARGKKVFDKILERARPKFEGFYARGAAIRAANFPAFVRKCQEDDSFWTFGAGLYERVTAIRPDGHPVREFTKTCPPVYALLLAVCMAQYERCIRDVKSGPSLRAGKFDLYMAVYLPYCDRFISADTRQLRCFEEINAVGLFHTEITDYQSFRDNLLLADT